MTTTTSTVGSGGDYATIPLWFSGRGDQPARNDIEECVLLDGSHDWAGSQQGWNDVGPLTIRFKGQTPQDGEWTTGANLVADDTLSFKRTNDLTLEFSDLQLVNDDYANLQIRTDTSGTSRELVISMSGVLLTMGTTSPFIRPRGGLGDSFLNFTNCVFENNRTDNNGGNLLNMDDQAPCNFHINLVNCTFRHCRLWAYKYPPTNPDHKSQIVTRACIMDQNTSMDSGRFFRFSEATGAYLGGSSIDNITNEPTSHHQAWATSSLQNTTMEATINVSGTAPSNGEVSFDGSGGGNRDSYMLVDHVNNLALDYVVSGPSLGLVSPSEDLSKSTRLGTVDCGAFERPRLKNQVTPVNLF